LTFLFDVIVRHERIRTDFFAHLRADKFFFTQKIVKSEIGFHDEQTTRITM